MVRLEGDPLSPLLFLFYSDGLSALLRVTCNDDLLKGVQEYEWCSGKQINFGKSLIYFSSNVDHGIHATIEGVLSVRSIADPRNYLGLPMVVGSDKKCAFQAIKDHFLGKFRSWYNQCFSQGGKAVFIKSILQVIQLYSISCFFISQFFL